ncbi:MAG: hypothetical protein JSU01_03550 [Bacteroidetes bacterium]|nr:hypothetical protein [Bacteroidota bacterium]
MKYCLLSLLIFFTSCQYDPYADNLATIEPNVKDVVGTYVFEQQTIANTLKDGQIKLAIIILDRDSSFTAIKVPNFDGSNNYQGVISAKGKWQISTNGGVANGSGGTDSVWGLDLTTLPDNLQHPEFLGHKPPYKLIFTYGDPDEGAVMIFRKK